MNKKRMWLCVIILVLCSIFTVRAEVAEGNDSKEVYTEGIHLEAEDTEGELESLYTQWQEKSYTQGWFHSRKQHHIFCRERIKP